MLPWKTIQFGVDNVGSNGTVNVATGTYTENVVVTQPVTVSGAGQGNTIVVPATSAPNPCVGSSLCGGAASVVFLIRSASVNIAGLTVDGDNPANASGVVVNGADIDARDGIETDFNAGVFNQLTVFNVTVKNIFLRGIEFTDGSGYLITGNNINNVAGDSSNSIAIDGDSAAGTISGNNVSNTPGAIGTNHSKGTSMTGNAITTSDSGIHSDNNGDSGGVADSITNNNVTCTTGARRLYVRAVSEPDGFGQHVSGSASASRTSGAATSRRSTTARRRRSDRDLHEQQCHRHERGGRVVRRRYRHRLRRRPGKGHRRSQHLHGLRRRGRSR